MDSTVISALLVGGAGLVTALGAYFNSASKSDLERLKFVLDTQDKSIKDQATHILKLESDVTKLARSNRILRRALAEHNIPIPTEALIEEM